MNGFKSFILLWLALLGLSAPAQAHVSTPVDLELSIEQDGHYILDATGHLESILSGASSTASLGIPRVREAYERFEQMSDAELKEAFSMHSKRLTQRIKLFLNEQPVALTLKSVSLSGHNQTQEGRLGTVTYEGRIDAPIETINFGYSRSLGLVLFKYRHRNPKTHAWSDWQLLSNIPGRTQASQSIKVAEDKPQPLSQTVLSYLYLGYTHILPKGVDHILFIVGLFLLSVRFKPLIAQVTAFTLAHTLTLGLAMKGIVHVPPVIVEPLIAFSIAYIGIENILEKNLHKFRIVVVFVFGLLHGLGFASVLNDLGVPQGQFASALISFNVGVEIGQLSILILAYVILAIPFKQQTWYRSGIVIPASLAIAAIGLYWGIERSWNAFA